MLKSKRFFLLILCILNVMLYKYLNLQLENISHTKKTVQEVTSTTSVDYADTDSKDFIQMEKSYARKQEIKRQEEKAEINKKYEELGNELSNYLKEQSGSYGVYFINLENGQIISYNSEKKFVGASTVKLPINLYIYELRSQGKLSKDTLLKYTKDCYETGTGTLQYNKAGGYYSIQDLNRLSIRISDNVAANMLLKEAYGSDFFNYIENLVGHNITPWHNIWSAKDMALIMKGIYDFSQRNSELGNEFMNNLENTIFNDRINKYLPNVVTAHKIGNQINTMNDVGIVFAKEPYVIAFMSGNVDENKACEVIARSSKMVYDFIQNN